MEHSRRVRKRYGANAAVTLASSFAALLALAPVAAGRMPPSLASDTVAGGPVLRTISVAATPIALLADITAGRIFVFGQATHESSITVLDAATGRVLAVRHLGRTAFVPTAYGAPPAAVDPTTGRVFVPTSRQTDPTGHPHGPGRLWILDGRTGAVRRTISVGYAPQAVALDAATRRLFILNGARADAYGAAIGEPSLSVIDTTTGRPLHTLTRVGGSALAVDAATGRLFIADGTDVDVRVAATGAPLRRVALTTAQVQEDVLALAVDERAARVVVGLTDATGLPDGRVLDATTGAVVYGSRAISIPFALAPTAGRIVAVATPLSSTGGAITATVIGLHAGRVLRTVTLDRATARAVAAAVASDDRDGTTLIATARGLSAPPYWTQIALSILATRDGRLISRLLLAPGPPAIAIDAATRRAFVTSGAAHTVSILTVPHP